MNIKICRMTSKHAKEVSELGLTIKEFQYDLERNTTYSEDDIKRVIKSKNAICLIAKVDNNKLAGFIIRVYHPFFKEDYLSEIFVKEQYRNNGIAQMLIDKSSNILKDIKAAWTWGLVEEENKNMQRFLEKNGFKKGRKFIFYHKDL